MKKIFTIFLFLLSLLPLQAQVINALHKDYIIDEKKADFYSYQQFKKMQKSFSFFNAKSIDSIPVQVHFVRNDDSSGQMTTLSNLQSDIDTLNNYFAAINLRFYLCPQPNYINNSQLYDFDYSQEIGLLMDSTKVPWALNFYYTGNVTMGNAKSLALGISVGNKYDGVIMDYDLVGNIIIVHELGHVFHLWHTHGKYNWNTSDCDYASWNSAEIPDEVWCQGAVMYDDNYTTDLNSDGIPDSEQTGDNIADTHAEPNLFEDSLTAGCNYIGTLLDYYGMPYNPIVGNHMSYGPCANHFTNGQYLKMRWAYEQYGMKWNCGGCTGNANTIVTTNQNSGKGSLRWALDCANCNNNKTIAFSLPDTASKVITLSSSLPSVTSNVIINGSTQTGGIVTLNGSNLQKSIYENGFFIEGDNVEINNLKISHFPGHGINNHFGHNNLLVRNCTISNVGYQGIYNNKAANSIFHNNTIYNCGYNGILLLGCKNNTITGNTISSNAYHGIYMDSCQNIMVGDTGIGKTNTLIQNAYDGVIVYNQSNNIQICNNFIGTNAAGNSGLGNGSHGVNINKSYNINIGGPAKGNVISGNGYDGIMLFNSTRNVVIKGNKIGVAPDGVSALANASTGIIVVKSTQVVVGGDCENEENQIANNPTSVYLMDSSQQVLMQRNNMYCSNWAVYFEPSNNFGMAKPVVTAVPDSYSVQGTSIPNATLWIYKSDANCTSCEGKIFLGKTTALGNAWQLNTTIPIFNDDKITAMAEYNGCSSPFADCFSVSGLPINIDDEEEDDVVVFPNPTKDKLFVQFSNVHSETFLSCSIINILGISTNCVLQKVAKNQYCIDLGDMATGVYQLKIKGQEKVFIKHFVKTGL